MNNMNKFFRAMRVIDRALERDAQNDDIAVYDEVTAYNTEDRELLTEDWAAMNDIFGTHDTVIERYADGMVDGNICHRI